MAGQSTERGWGPSALLISIAVLGGILVACIWGLDWRWLISSFVVAVVLVVACGVRDGRSDSAAEDDDDLDDWFSKLGSPELRAKVDPNWRQIPDVDWSKIERDEPKDQQA